jgi:uncharacterized damage-inducible protein DinB
MHHKVQRLIRSHNFEKELKMESKLEATSAVLTTTPQRWESLAGTLPEDLFQRPPAPGEWSAADCARHLLTVERDLLGVRFHHILKGRPELIPYDPNTPQDPIPERSFQEIVAAFIALRRENLRALSGLQAEDLNRSSFHPEYGVDVTLEQLLDLWAAHDLQHTVQAEEALMQAFIPGTSVWRPEFADHDVEAKG